ncbi:hypothetical protein EON63_13580, partial [archaeon]
MRTARNLKLVALDWTRPKDPPLSLGHASILAVAIKRGLQVQEKSWSVNSPAFHAQDVVDHILSRHNTSSTDVAFGVYIWNENYIQQILTKLKTGHFQGRIILGGPQISYTKSNLESFYPQADVFIRGYAEEALVDLVAQSNDLPIDKSGSHYQGRPVIPGVHYAHMQNNNSKATVSLEDLPSPYLTGVIKPQKFIRWETHRGCKFKCKFCQHREPEKSLIKTKYFAEERTKKEVHLIPYTLYPIPYTLYPIPYTLYPIPYTLYPIPYT